MPMSIVEIERSLKTLRLPGIRATLETRSLQASQGDLSFLDAFSLLLQDEMDRRKTRLMERRFKQSGLSERKTLTDFDWGFNPKIPKRACFELITLKFIQSGEDAVLIGQPGTGKVTSQKPSLMRRLSPDIVSCTGRLIFCFRKSSRQPNWESDRKNQSSLLRRIS